MKRILHILKKKDAPLAMEVIRNEALTHAITVILIQEATALCVEGGAVFVLEDDAPASTPYPKIGYSQMLDAIFQADQVVTW